jgi:hypothetical protein
MTYADLAAPFRGGFEIHGVQKLKKHFDGPLWVGILSVLFDAGTWFLNNFY